jgi:hypothetical protein
MAMVELRPRRPTRPRRQPATLGPALLWLAGASPALGADTVPKGARQALTPVTAMIGTLVAIAVGLGIAVSVLVLECEVGTANGSGQLRLSTRELESRGELRGDFHPFGELEPGGGRVTESGLLNPTGLAATR